MGYASITIPFCEDCCGETCPETDLDLVITGGSCTFSCVPNQNLDRWLSGTIPLAGGFTLIRSGTAYTATFPLGDLQLYNDADCEEFAGDISGSTLRILVVCGDPDEEGRRYSMVIDVQTLLFGTFTLYVSPEKFNLGQEVIIETACGEFSIIVTEP